MRTAYATFRDRMLQYHIARSQQTLFASLLLAAGWAVVMGLLAQLRIPLPFTPVPITMQVFGVVLGVALLGPVYGGAAQLIYVAVGIIGVPWFQNHNGGLDYFLGATGGYLLAYPIAAWAMGTILSMGTPTLWRFQAASFASLAVIYAVGTTWLAFALRIPLSRAFALGVAPFLVVDAVKIALAAAISRPFAWR